MAAEARKFAERLERGIRAGGRSSGTSGSPAPRPTAGWPAASRRPRRTGTPWPPRSSCSPISISLRAADPATREDRLMKRSVRSWSRRLACVLGLAARAVGLVAVDRTGPAARTVGPARPATVLVRIPPGMTLAAAADTLAARGLLADRRCSAAGGPADRAGPRPAGRPLRTAPRSFAPGTAGDLTSGPAVQVQVTIPEGLDADEIAAILAEALGCVPARFPGGGRLPGRGAAWRRGLLDRSAGGRSRFPAGRRVGPAPARFRWCEGYLAPDTYLFAEGTGAATVARSPGRDPAGPAGFGAGRRRRPRPIADLTPHELLTLASIVEAEARLRR